jgi:hypothetical protein
MRPRARWYFDRRGGMTMRVPLPTALGGLAGAVVATVLGLLLAAAAPAAQPTLSVAATNAVVGQTIHATAELGESPSASGEISFEVFGPGDPTCVGPALTPAPAAAAVSGEGGYDSGDFTPPAAGAYSWKAHYSGDLENPSAESSCTEASVVSKASPVLAGVATSAATAGLPITDSATLSGGFAAGGQLVLRAYGPDDQTCTGAPQYEDAIAADGDGVYSPSGFSPAPGLYHWTLEYAGDANNEPAGLDCGTEYQASVVGTVSVALAASASGGTVGDPISATATITEGAIPGGQITFRAFSPGDVNCSGAAAFSSTLSVSGNGSYRSASFAPARVGTFRWTVAYSGDVNHNPATAACGTVASGVSQAKPSITAGVKRRLTVGSSLRITATLQGGYAPGGKITFEIYRPSASGCGKPLAVNTVPVTGNGTFSSDPLVLPLPGPYSFVAGYSGDAANQAATDSCDSPGQTVRVLMRTPKVKPRARLIGSNQISIRARLSGAASPSGVINFRLYRPSDKRCRHRPVFSGGVSVGSNGSFLLARYLATEPGVYRLSVGYSGDPRNQRYKDSCSGAQSIRVG